METGAFTINPEAVSLPIVLRSLQPQIAGILEAASSPTAVDSTISILRSIVRVDFIVVYLRDGADKLRLAGWTGLDTAEALEAQKSAWERHPGEVVRSKRPFLDNEVRDQPGTNSLVYTETHPIRSRVYVPMISGDRCLGAIGLASLQKNAFTQDSIALLEFICLILTQTLVRNEKTDQLSSTASRLGNVIDNTHVGVLLEDENRRVLHSNQAFCDMFGIPVPPSMLVGADCEASLHQSKGLFMDPEAFVTRVHEILAQRRIVKRERLRLKDGRTFDLDFVPIFNRGRFEGILWNYDDVTEHIRHEREMAVAAKVIEEERLKAQNSARLASLGEMAGGIAHEMNTPLAIIATLAGQLVDMANEQDGSLEAAMIRSHCTSIENTAHRIARIIQSLRRLSRDAGQDAFKEVPIREVIDDALNLCGEALRNRGVELILDCPEPAPAVNCRPAELSQVVINLLSNANDAVKNAEVKRVRLACSRRSETREVQLTVSDSGPGIDPRIRHRLFEPFFTTKAVGEGTGLGLGISKRIVENHGGRLEYDASAPETTFRIMLPPAGS